MKKASMLLLVGLFAATTSADWSPQPRQCQILDHVGDPTYSAYFGYVPDSRIDSLGSSRVLEMGGHWDFAYFRNVGEGNMDLGLHLGSVQFTKPAGSFNAPDQLVSLYVDGEWDWRFGEGLALQLGARPGIYGDLGDLGGSLFMPVRVAMIQAFLPNLSGIAGFEVRPSFERLFMPIIGVAWAITDHARLEAQWPVSRFVYTFDQDWSAYASWAWNSISYRLDRRVDMLTLEDSRFGLGVTRQLTADFRVTGEVGRIGSRTAEYEGIEPVDIESATYLRFALGGPF